MSPLYTLAGAPAPARQAPAPPGQVVHSAHVPAGGPGPTAAPAAPAAPAAESPLPDSGQEGTTMRLILTGCEYAGKSTLASALHAWGQRQGFQFHLDDHFTVPDSSLTTDEERRYAAAAPPAMKE